MKLRYVLPLLLMFTLPLLPACSGGSKWNTSSGNANLSNITISDGIALSPAFAAGTTAYTATAPSTLSNVDVTVYGGHTAQTIEVNGDEIDSGMPSPSASRRFPLP